jgi:hypothetical protein
MKTRTAPLSRREKQVTREGQHAGIDERSFEGSFVAAGEALESRREAGERALRSRSGVQGQCPDQRFRGG